MKKIRLYVLTGFLGAGKTTVLTHILNEIQGKKIGVIQNEFGKLGIDGRILQDHDIEMVEINRGSIFCSCLKLSFIEALDTMSKQGLDYVFVESSGLGDPSNVEEILAAVSILAGDSYEFGGVICLVDAVGFGEQRKDLETVQRQLKHCHLAVITKKDLVTEKEILELEEEIRRINPGCSIRQAAMGNLSLGFLEEDLLQYGWAEGEKTTNSEENKPKTISLSCEEGVEREKLFQVLNKVKKSTYRIKGFFLLENGWNQIDVVGDRMDCKPCEPKEISQLVFISKVGPAIIKELFEEWKAVIGQKMELKN